MNMKKIYFLALLSCLSFAVFGQTTVDIFSTGATGSFTTATAVNFGAGIRQDGNIGTSGTVARGYAVFNLSSIPVGATVTSCLIGFTVSTVTGTPATCATYGYAGNLSTVTVEATLFADMVSGPLLSNVNYAATVSNQVLPSTAASTNFIQTNEGNTVSICWTGGGTAQVGIIGEAGVTSTTSASGAPYLQITYTCPGVSGVAASATPNPVCVGAPITLNASGTGVTSYSWAGPGGYTSAMQNPTLTTSSLSFGVYTLTAYTASGCATQATVNVASKITPSGIITGSPLLFCQGQGVTLSTLSGAGYTYQWYNNGTLISGATNQTYNDSVNGSITAQITYTVDGCVGTTPSTIVSVLPHDPLLTPAGNTVVCVGSDLTLAVDLTGIVTTGVTYQWMDGGIAIAGATLPTYTTNTSGAYNVILSTAVCNDTSQTTDLTISLLPNPPISYYSGVLSTSSGYANYQWFLNLVSIPGATSSTLNAAKDGSYRVRVTDVNGCTNYSSPYDLYTLGVSQLSNADINIYPNPADKMIHINAPVAVRAIISSVEGKKLMDVTDATDIDIDELPGGLYIIMLYNDAGERLKVDKLIKN